MPSRLEPPPSPSPPSLATLTDYIAYTTVMLSTSPLLGFFPVTLFMAAVSTSQTRSALSFPKEGYGKKRLAKACRSALFVFLDGALINAALQERI